MMVLTLSVLGSIDGEDSSLSDSVIASFGTNKNSSFIISGWTGMTDSENNVKIKAKATNENHETEWVTLYDSASNKLYNVLSSNNILINPLSGNAVFNINLSDRNTTIAIGAAPTEVYSITILLTQQTGSNLVNWGSNVKWSYNRPVVLSYEIGEKDIISLETYDKGVTWYGALIRAGV
ncbi:hypothetical protein QPL51_05315 [Escherichia coli]|uniref:hypothetical protein n=1 Tax=Escherichia coli TaxID=562 RepID=UPI0019885B05|nr:hypothetical protein [Escherichia coli]EGE6126614.1 hypothetical protein [Escherichia coli]MDS1552460.1 hypothetical protein [Escherichia coli]HAN4489956.1 hypothetical protein [Escherichia coli]